MADYKALSEKLAEYTLITQKILPRNVNDISQGEMAVLAYLRHEQDYASAGQLSRRFRVTTSRIAAILNSLEKKEFIKRVPSHEDQRKVLVHITQEGISIAAAKHREAIYELGIFWEELLEQLGEEDSLEFVRIMNRLTDILQQRKEI